MTKTIILTEGQKSELERLCHHKKENIDDILTESFCPNNQQVIIVKKYLDTNFKRNLIDDIDEYSKPIKKAVISRIIMNQPVEDLNGSDVVLILMDKFPKMISDKGSLKKFMEQVVKDWYDKKITDNGILSVNYL